MHCTCPNCKHEFEQKQVRTKKIKETDPTALSIVKYYAEKFAETYNAEPHIKWAACITAAKRLNQVHGEERTKELIDEYLVCDYSFFKDTGYNFLLIPSYVQKQAVKDKKEVKSDWRNPLG